MAASDQESVIYHSRLKMALLALGSALFVILSLWIGMDAGRQTGLPPALARLFALVGAGFFGLTLLYSLYRLIRRTPAVVIGPEGIVDNASALAVGLIRWDEIDQIAVYEVQGQKMLGIWPTAPERILERLSPTRRLLIQTSQAMMPDTPLISIPAVALSVSLDTLVARISQYRETAAG